MATSTYVPIATQTLGTAVSSITFSSIPGTYTDLRLVLTSVPSSATAAVYVQYNGDTAGNYSYQYFYGNGASALYQVPVLNVGSMIIGSKSQTSAFLATYDIFSYAGSTNKTGISTFAQDNNGAGTIEIGNSQWRSTAAITSLNVFVASGTFGIGTIATLWGI